MDPASGRGWAVIENGELSGRIFISIWGTIRRFVPGKPKREGLIAINREQIYKNIILMWE